MKKIFTHTVILLSATFFTSCSGAVDSLVRTNFIKSCKEQTPTEMNDQQKASFSKYCECSADKVIESMTLSELQEFDKNPNNITQEQQAKLMEVVKPCMEALEKDLSEN